MLAVVVFHAFPARFPGGFIGVDVFFIISGFLITSILIGNLNAGTYSVLDFYDRRIRRIFPALLLVLTACFAFGWFALLSDEFRELGKHMVSGAGFLSNFVLLSESGYFDHDTATKPLLHLWSLAVEEQFYIVWPLLMALMWKRKWNPVVVVLLILATSFALNIYLVGRRPDAAFYWPLSRAWELGLGSLLAWRNPAAEWDASTKNVQATVGLGLLLAGFVSISSSNAYPGWWGLVPALGTFLLISAGKDALINRYVLSNRLLVWVGLISYPVYLWHWPLLSFSQIVEGTPRGVTRVVAVAAAFVLAWLTYRLVERPIRNGSFAHRKSAALAGLMVAVGSVGFVCYQKDGFEGVGFRTVAKSQFARHFDEYANDWKRLSPAERARDEEERCDFYDTTKARDGHATNVPRDHIPANCYQRDKAHSHGLFVWGDSHAGHVFRGLIGAMPDDWQLMDITTSGCTPKAGVAKPSTPDYCAYSNWFAFSAIATASPDVVLLVQDKGHTVEGLRALASALTAAGVKKVIIAGPVPHWKPDLPKNILRNLWDDTPRHTWIGVERKYVDIDESLRAGLKQDDRTEFVSLIHYFCPPEGCTTYYGEDRQTGITTADYGHLTTVAAERVAKNLLVPHITAAVPKRLAMSGN